MSKENVIKNRTYQIALDIVKTCGELRLGKHFELSSQLLRSGTSIGANVREAIGASSKKEFNYKLSIAYKEALETTYWIKLLMDWLSVWRESRKFAG